MAGATCKQRREAAIRVDGGPLEELWRVCSIEYKKYVSLVAVLVTMAPPKGLRGKITFRNFHRAVTSETPFVEQHYSKLMMKH